jgi:putative transposase
MRGDKQFLETPFYDGSQMTCHLRSEGHLVNEKRIRRLSRLMGFMPIYQKPYTSKAAKGHKIPLPAAASTGPTSFPSHTVLPGSGCADITYLPMRRGSSRTRWRLAFALMR